MPQRVTGPPPPGHPSGSAPRKRDSTTLSLVVVGALVGVAAVIGVVLWAVNGSGSSGASGAAGPATSFTALGCDPDRDSEALALCIERSVAGLPWCGVDLRDVSPIRNTSRGRGPGAPDTYLARYRVGSGSVDFLYIPDRDSLTVACGTRSRVVVGDDFRSLYEAGGTLPAGLR